MGTLAAGLGHDINNMLQNMHQGIFTILEDGTVHPEYSAYLRSILETEQIAHSNAMRLLFTGSDLDENTLDQVATSVEVILGEKYLMYLLNQHLLISEFQKTMSTGKFKILEVEWDPMLGEEGRVEKMMVTVRDVTELRALQKEAEQKKNELEMVGQILAISRESFDRFVQSANLFLNENQALIEQTPHQEERVLATLFRNLHTLKGNARSTVTG